MIVDIEIATGKQTVIEPINDADLEGLKEVMRKLYFRQSQKEREVAI